MKYYRDLETGKIVKDYDGFEFMDLYPKYYKLIHTDEQTPDVGMIKFIKEHPHITLLIIQLLIITNLLATIIILKK